MARVDPTAPPESLLPRVAREMAALVPELEGRSVAVSEADITRENMPTLPLCMVALVRMDGVNWSWEAANAERKLFDDFIIEFWLKPKKQLRADGTESPFWAFYDYEKWRDRILGWATGFYGPRGQRLEFRNMTVESDEYAVVLSFRFRAHYNWCRTEDDEEPTIIGRNAKVIPALCQPVQECCPEDCEKPKECDACSSP